MKKRLVQSIGYPLLFIFIPYFIGLIDLPKELGRHFLAIWFNGIMNIVVVMAVLWVVLIVYIGIWKYWWWLKTGEWKSFDK